VRGETTGTFKELLAQVIEWLRQDGRVSYRAFKRQFDLDNDYLESWAIFLIGYDVKALTLNP
jgi:hypothetical protein